MEEVEGVVEVVVEEVMEVVVEQVVVEDVQVVAEKEEKREERVQKKGHTRSSSYSRKKERIRAREKERARSEEDEPEEKRAEKKEREKLTSSRDKLTSSRDKLTSSRDKLTSSRDKLTSSGRGIKKKEAKEVESEEKREKAETETETETGKETETETGKESGKRKGAWRKQSKSKRQVIGMRGPHEFELVKLLGRGDVGRVYLVKHTTSGKAYAMKAMNKAEMIQRNKIQRALTEREILATSKHPFIVTLYYSFQTSSSLFFIMDFCAGGEFFRFLQQQPSRRLPEAAARFYAAEVLLGLEYLHMMGYIYRDLKPENILLHRSGHVMLTDFNLSKGAQTPTQAKLIHSMFASANKAKVEMKPELVTNSFVGTEEYIAPEVISGMGHDSSVDWWTFGILLFEMLYGFTPFKGRTRDETFAQILKRGMTFPDSPAVSKDARSIIKKLLQVDPRKRLGASHGAADVKAHDFFQDTKWALLLHQPPPIHVQVHHNFDTRNFRPMRDDHLFTSDLEMPQAGEDDPFACFKRVTSES